MHSSAHSTVRHLALCLALALTVQPVRAAESGAADRAEAAAERAEAAADRSEAAAERVERAIERLERILEAMSDRASQPSRQ